ncbi:MULTISPECIES: RecQ family ATP-dependent DNA helicase [Tenacibaculum]|uniref:RecQ family ATP-dependent DNA helicase n=1 Tax=Tenacibaculum TaxID=104267 RepID=UPI001F0B6D1A|nr:MULTISPECIES: ATP-dependent DNA helicase RecQ [Tenacibaculum]MCH3882613.1 RecQ family ATP-dependent DNA helicase [Tenacibaculum aquimarinum]MDO6600660.1 ATP-dependent DNA helicase RecQ [Tenacibaculum sp. 1_MG-2023]
MISPLEILQKYWKHTSFREPQAEIINAVLAKKNTIALLPTGGGKSVCFQVPGVILDGICIVISPLIALMQDQVEGLQKRGIKATTIPSKSTPDEIVTIFDNLKFGNYKFLYISPERLQSALIQQKIKELNVSIIAIDEAHCISEWGHDFRPSYRNINKLRELKPEATTIALTASATKKVLDDISKSLDLEATTIFKKSFFRDNLAYQIFTIEDKLYRLKQIFTKTTSPAIVYVNSRKKTAQISSFLNANGFKSSFYNGGLSNIEKEVAFENWMTEKTPIMVATNAFGMGIDKANVKVVVHYDFPNSVENYLQEAGRAGRNGKKSFAVLLKNANDIRAFKEQTEMSLPSLTEVKEIHKKLYQHFQIAKGELLETIYDFNFLEFCKKYKFTPSKAATVLTLLVNNGIIEVTTNFAKKSSLQFNVNSSRILNYKADKQFIKTLLRTYGGLFEQETKINEFILAKKASITSNQVITNLERLETEGLLTYKQATNNSEVKFLQAREDDRTINRRSREITQFLSQKKQKAENIVAFIENDSICRNIQLLSYFGEKKAAKCKMCDVCLAAQKTKSTISEKEILILIAEKKLLSSKEICTFLDADEQDILVHLRQLLSEEKLGLNNQNKFFKL